MRVPSRPRRLSRGFRYALLAGIISSSFLPHWDLARASTGHSAYESAITIVARPPGWPVAVRLTALLPAPSAAEISRLRCSCARADQGEGLPVDAQGGDAWAAIVHVHRALAVGDAMLQHVWCGAPLTAGV